MKKNLEALINACGSPKAIKSLNGWLTVFWIAMVPLALLTSLKTSLLFVVLISLWANIASHFAGWVAGRVEVKQDDGA